MLRCSKSAASPVPLCFSYFAWGCFRYFCFGPGPGTAADGKCGSRTLDPGPDGGGSQPRRPISGRARGAYRCRLRADAGVLAAFLAVFFVAAFLPPFLADFFTADFLAVFLAFLAFFGITFLTTALTASVVALAALLIASVVCSRTDLSSSISSPRVYRSCNDSGIRQAVKETRRAYALRTFA
jgi:hypothetical protein